jgi:riboflavin synthase
MFSGIVESVSAISFVESHPSLARIKVKKPSSFMDLHIGDSVAVDGVCLTLEQQSDVDLTFALAAETLQVLKMDPKSLLGKKVNLERSLRLGDRIHGHLVTGHVDSTGSVIRSEGTEESWFLDVKVGSGLAPLIWKKGSITLNGVSLTVNEMGDGVVSVCLIPETLKRTNLADLRVGDRVNVESDYFAKALVHQFGEKINELRGLN